MNDEKLDQLLNDTDADLDTETEEGENDETLIDFGDDDVEAVTTTTTTTDIVATDSSNTIQKVGIVAIIGLIGWFFAKKMTGKKEDKKEGGTNFKPVDFGF